MRCGICNAEHPDSAIQPSFRRPDAVVVLTPSDRLALAQETDDLCVLRRNARETKAHRFFVRCVHPVGVAGAAPTAWGLWAEVGESAYARIVELWTDPAQGKEPPIAAHIANRVPGYPETVGLPCFVRLVDPRTRARIEFAPTEQHPFAAECRAGITQHRLHEWLQLV